MEEKIEQINQLLEEKGIDVLDDYFLDFFQKDGKTLFTEKSSRLFKTDDEAIETLDEIIQNLKEL